MATKSEIVAEYRALQTAKDEIGTVEALARKHGITKSRLYQIVQEFDANCKAAQDRCATRGEL
mgnify:CR=1 FL=1